PIAVARARATGGIVGVARVQVGLRVRCEVLLARMLLPATAALLPLFAFALPPSRLASAAALALVLGITLAILDAALVMAGGLLQTLGLLAPGSGLASSWPVQAMLWSTGGASVAVAAAAGSAVGWLLAPGAAVAARINDGTILHPLAKERAR